MIKKLKSLLIAALIFGALFIVGLVGINVVMTIIVGSKNEVKVPNIIGMHVDSARKKCKELNLYLKVTDEVVDDEVPANQIISQDPVADKITKSSRTIEVIVSKGSEPIRVPYLDNITEREAKLRLQNVGLILGTVSYNYSDVVEKDKIIDSDPKADVYTQKNRKINITVSLGRLPDSSQKRERYRNILDEIEE